MVDRATKPWMVRPLSRHLLAQCEVCYNLDAGQWSNGGGGGVGRIVILTSDGNVAGAGQTSPVAVMNRYRIVAPPRTATTGTASCPGCRMAR